MFERRHEPLLPRAAFHGRLLRSVALAAGLIGVSLMLGIFGYHWVAGLSWIDSILNASMILAGMGPVSDITRNSGKLFASAYALFSGVAFLTSVSVVLAPLLHRFLHHFHMQIDQDTA